MRSAEPEKAEYASFVVKATTSSAPTRRPVPGTSTAPVTRMSAASACGSALMTPSSCGTPPAATFASAARAAVGKSGVMFMFCHEAAPPKLSYSSR